METLRQIPIFKTLSEKSIDKLNDILHIKKIQENHILYYEGELLENAYFLINGCVELYKMEQNNNEMFLCYVNEETKNRLINAFSSFEYYCASAGVRSVKHSEIACFDLLKLSILVKEQADIANIFLKEYMNKAIVFKNIIDFNGIYDSTSKLAFILKTQLTRFNQTQRQVIAKELNIKLETLSRILQKMLKDELIKKDKHGNIFIYDKAKFIELYGDISLR